ncbi:MAG: ArsR family transcriptional regulator [Cyanobacteria bacterium PR.3.49]|nr:ArsR family transcriptional regulator [Cyanobacteria bacterium PR.3.49]
MHKLRETEQLPCDEPAIRLVTRRLADFFKVLSNARRVLILEELGSGERDVSSLTNSLQVSQSTISQQLAVLRAHKLINERREGRTVLYSLRTPELAAWIVDGLKFAGLESKDEEGFLLAIERVQTAWRSSNGEG